ncbi:MAG: 30S ribosomal protein S2 [Patescibacteria group bacterium]
MSKLPTLLDMLQAGAHFGHQKSRWHPKMEQYIFGARNNVHIIDLEKTLEEMEKASGFVKDLVAKGGNILFLGTKRQARDSVKTAAESCGMPYLVERWIGGLLTNFEEMRRRLKKYKTLKEQIASGEIEKYTKKEQVTMRKQIEHMDKYLIGLISLEKIPDAIYIADLRLEKTAVAEARRKHIPIIAVCDTNTDPTKADYAIPANDDVVKSIKMMADFISEAVKEGKDELEKNKIAAATVKEKQDKARAKAIEDEKKSSPKEVKAKKRDESV